MSKQKNEMEELITEMEVDENEETMVDAVLQEIEISAQSKSSRRIVSFNDDSTKPPSFAGSSLTTTSSNNSQETRPSLGRRSSMTLGRILETMTTMGDVVNSDDSFKLQRDESDLGPNGGNGFSSRPMRGLSHSLRTQQDVQHPSVERFLRRVIQEEFPQEVHPTLRDLIHCGPSRQKGNLYKPGDWVEIQGSSMVWQLEMVTRVIKQAPPDWDWNDAQNENKDPDWEYYYHAGTKRMMPAEELRAPKEGLLRLFGPRPFLWQQWTCLKLEQTLRFQKGHQQDFSWKDCSKFALDYWERWLHHPQNIDFFNQFHDDRIGDFGRRQLVDHVMRPFMLMERIKHDPERWDFRNDDAISVYSYLSVFGTMFLLPCIIVLLQFSIPALLFMHLDSKDEDGRSELCKGFDNLIWYGSVGDECLISENAQAMAIVILGYYLVRVVPDTMASFYNVLGATDTAYSKLQSLRHCIWKRREDRLGQVLGYQMDIYMNTAYVCLLYMLNILVIINTDDAFEIVLNALAFEFVIDLDHAFAKSAWWDADKRWIKAGALELVLQRTIHKAALTNYELFSKEYHIPLRDLKTLFEGSKTLLKDDLIARQDAENEAYMTNDEKIKFRCRNIARELQNKHAIDEYEKSDVDFGYMRILMRYLCRRKGGGVFDRYHGFRTWSRWQKLLFLPPLPSLDKTFDESKSGSFRVKKDLNLIVPTCDEPFENFENNSKSEWETFRNTYIKVVTFREMCGTLKWTCSDKTTSSWRKAVVLLFDGPAKWIAFVVQGVFPFYNAVCFIAVIVARATGKD